MATDERRVHLKIDVSTGVIEIDAAAEDFAQATEKTAELMRSVSFSPRPKPNASDDTATPAEPAKPPVSPPTSEKAKPRTKGGSSGRVGRLGSFEPVKLGLTEEQERALRAFMAEKKAVEQPDQIAVAMFKGAELLGRTAFGYNEIYTLLKDSGVRDLPKALDVVLSRMIDSAWVVKDGQQFSLKFIGRDHVEQRLPPSA